MDPQLTRLYQDELTHLRELGAEFAREHPKIAARLALDGLEVADPYVERLLEGFAFLAARVRLKLDAEQPQLIAHLLESMAPNFLAPVPSMMIAKLAVDTNDPNLARGYTLPRGSAVQSLLPRGQDTLCDYRTAMAVTLWPIEIVQVQLFAHAADLPLAHLPPARAAKSGLRVRLRVGGGLDWSQLGTDRLAFYIAAGDDTAFRLHELLLGRTIGTLVWEVGRSDAVPGERWRGDSSVRPLGYDADQALLPESLRGFSGHRLLQEVAALPQRALFFEVGDLASRLRGVRRTEVDLVLMFAGADPGLEPLVDAGSLALHCTPAINLFRKRLDRIVPGPGSWEYHVVADRTRPMDYEVHSLETVVGHGSGNERLREFEPLYSTRHQRPAAGHGYYTLRRAPRMPSEQQRQHGARVPSYLGEEVFVSLADPGHGPYRESLSQLSVVASVTNRDLPALLPQGGGDGAWRLDASGPVTGVSCLRGPTRPVSRQPVGAIGWQLITLLAQNHLDVGDDAGSLAALRDLLRLWGPPNDPAWSRQADGLRRFSARRVVRRLPFAGPLSFGTGVEIALEVDEQHFQGASAFLLGSVLERLFARHAAVNSFVELTLASAQRGLIKTWPPHGGGRSIV